MEPTAARSPPRPGRVPILLLAGGILITPVWVAALGWLAYEAAMWLAG